MQFYDYHYFKKQNLNIPVAKEFHSLKDLLLKNQIPGSQNLLLHVDAWRQNLIKLTIQATKHGLHVSMFCNLHAWSPSKLSAWKFLVATFGLDFLKFLVATFLHTVQMVKYISIVDNNISHSIVFNYRMHL